jgi:hypothetical protein
MSYIEGTATMIMARATATIVASTAVRTIKRIAMVKIALAVVAVAAVLLHTIMQSVPAQLLAISSLLLYPRS